MKNRILAILILLLMSACAELVKTAPNWSDDLPQYSYFYNEYQRDSINSKIQPLDQYLTWVERFYHGWELYPNGWNTIKQDLLQRITDQAFASEVAQKMDDLGLSISQEWAKNNDTRIINTRHVSIWGNALVKSLQHGETLEIIARINADVQDLVLKNISADLITENRFYAEDDIFKDIN